MSLHASRKPEAALHVLQTALAIDPKNTLAKFKLASVLTTLGQYEVRKKTIISLSRLIEFSRMNDCFVLKKALLELEQLQDYSPKEASVYFLMGIIYRKMGRIQDAIACLSVALDLDSKNSTIIKSTIEKLQNTGGEGTGNIEDEDDLILELT
jgi:anaphase-promoting complex subunit 3